MNHRISVTGAQGTGKSTLAGAIAGRFRASGLEVALHVGLGDKVAGGGLPLGALAGAESVRAFVNWHQARESAGSEAVQIFDRCLLDTLAYAHVLACLPRTELESLRTATIASCARLTRLIWLRVTTDYPVQSARDETPRFRRAIDVAIGTLRRENGIALVEHSIPPDCLEDIVSMSIAESIRRATGGG